MDATRPLVLIVDDQPVNLKVLARTLDHDFAVQVATNGADAFALACRPPYPAVILLDVLMPGMDGYAVCAALKHNPVTADIPVVFITAKTDAESETAALQAGAADFIPKPINPEVVCARVHLQHELARHRHHLEELVHTRTQELARARDAAEGANRAKTAFLRNASHEMRTPLHQITGLCHLLRGALTERRDHERLDALQAAAQRLLGLVSDLLDFTRLEAGELAVEARAFDPSTLLAPLLASWEPAAAAKGLRLSTSVDPELPETLIGDPDRLTQAIAQLLDNAIKFSDQGEIEIRIGAGERSGRRLRLRVEVADQGIGLDPALAGHLFTLFQAGDDSLTRQHPGLGLGLALCQRLVRLMLGEIHLASQPGQGATVGFWVPLELPGPTDL